MDRDSVLLDAVARMRSLRLTDVEIEARLLKEVPSLTAAQVRSLLNRSPSTASSTGTEVPLDIQPDELWLDTLPAGEESVSGGQGPVSQKAVDAPVSAKVSSSGAQSTASSLGASELWQKAILATVNQKLDEMIKIRAELDALIDQRVAASNEREMAKFRVLLESQRSLLLSRVDGVLDSKSKDLVDLINARVKELSASNAEVNTSIAAFRQERDTQRQFVSDFKRELSSLSETKQQLLAELHKELDALRAQNAEMERQSQERMDGYAAQVQRLLELQSKASEGLVSDASKKIRGFSDQRYEELDSKLSARFEQLSSEVHSSVSSLEHRFNEESSRVAHALSDLESFYTLARSDLDPDKYRSRMLELEEQRKAVLVSSQQRVDELGRRMEEDARASEALRVALQARLDALDAKMREWKSFETDFARAMGLALEEFRRQSATAKRGLSQA